MNQVEQETNGALLDAIPLFASNLLALFYVLRKNFNERRVVAEQATAALQLEED